MSVIGPVQSRYREAVQWVKEIVVVVVVVFARVHCR